MSAAALDVQTHDDLFAVAAPLLVRQQAAEVLAAHRSRRQRPASDRPQSAAPQAVQSESSRSQRIASRVSERYAQSQSYRSFLEAEAEEATRKAKAVAEVAARTAQAVAEAQQQLLEELARAEAFIPVASAVLETFDVPESPRHSQPLPAIVEDRPYVSPEVFRAGLSVRLLEEPRIVAQPTPKHAAPAQPEYFEEAEALDEEISFRQSPSFDLEQASVPIPGNLLEFPRQLVAARKARPLYAEGPLTEAAESAHSNTQLRIFEVEPSQITSQPPVEASATEWSSIWLDALTEPTAEEAVEPVAAPTIVKPVTASFERRLMAGIVDASLVAMAFVVFAAFFAYNAAALPSLTTALVASAVVLVGLSLLYMALFFAFSNSTPGMRYARIDLCTFDEENPSRAVMLARIPATILAAFPLGLGFLWACLDEDRLGWHDRLSRTYQRSY